MKPIIDNQRVLDEEIKKLDQFNLYSRWVVVVLCWLLLIPWSIWEFRESIEICQNQCTWATVRLALEFNPFAALAISFCIGLPTSVLVKQSIYILRGGLSDQEKYYLRQRVQKIGHQGRKNLLYQWVYGKNSQ